MENTTLQRKSKTTNMSTSWDVVEAYAVYIAQKFGQRMSKALLASTKAECAEKGIQWLSSEALKGCLSHYSSCSSAPDVVRRRATTLIRQLSRPDLLDPWLTPPNKACAYCSNSEEAIVAIINEDKERED